MLKKKFSILRILLASLIGLFLLGYILLLIPGVQTYLSRIVAGRISNTLGTEVSVGKVGFSLFDKLDIENVLVKDTHKDTLIFARSFKLRISDLFFSSNTPTIKYIGLDKATIYIHRETEKWNYQFVLDYLNKDTSSKNSANKIDLKKIDITNIHFVQTDQWVGERMVVNANNILVNIKSTIGNNIAIDQITVNKPYYLLEQIKGLQPNNKDTVSITNLSVNSSHTSLSLNELKIINGKVWIENGTKTPLPFFDADHIRIEDLNATLQNIKVQEDTIKANVKFLQLKERSGLEIKKLSTQFKLTPRIMEFDQLSLKTNKSIIGDYYAMEYTHFAKDFQDYIHKVTMKSHLKESVVYTDDIAFFAPEMRNLHQQANLSTQFTGTVANFVASNLTAQYNKSFVSGELTMQGIPDMRNTQIQFKGVMAKTNYKDLSNWIPALKNIKEFPFEEMGEIVFKGDFNGSIYDFETQGKMNTKLGLAETKTTTVC